jgi:HD-like signal output (HDOD) protein
MVAERWDLPARHVAAIAHHHNPADAGDERLFCTLVGLADQAAYTAFSPYTPVEHHAERIALLDALDLGPGHWDDCLCHLHEARTTIEAFVGAIQ